MVVDERPLDEDAISPAVRALFAVAALALLRWTYYRTGVRTATTAQRSSKRRRSCAAYIASRRKEALRDQDYARALPPLMALNRIQPRNHVYLWQRALVLGALHRPLEEIEALEQFVKVSPVPGEACPRLAFLYREQGMGREALDAFARCAGYSPNDMQDAFYYGHALEADGQIDRALEVYEQATKHGANEDDEAEPGSHAAPQGQADSRLRSGVRHHRPPIRETSTLFSWQAQVSRLRHRRKYPPTRLSFSNAALRGRTTPTSNMPLE